MACEVALFDMLIGMELAMHGIGYCYINIGTKLTVLMLITMYVCRM
jgi:hypothetical protein